MPSSGAIREYLYKLTPSIDKGKWDKATNFIGNTLNKNQAEYNKILEKQEEEQKNLVALEERRLELLKIKDKLLSKQKELGGEGKDADLDALIKSYTSQISGIGSSILDTQTKLEVFGDELKSSGNTANNVIGKNLPEAAFKMLGLVDLFKDSVEKMISVLDKASEMGNKFISSSSIFVDEDVKSTMARYGTSNTKAQAIVKAQEQLGISESDYATMTQGQRDAFEELMKHYEDGLNSIDPDKLERFNEATQKYQMMTAKFNMDLDLAITKLFAESDKLPELVDTLEDFLDSVIDLLSSDAAQFAFDTFLSFLNTIVKVLSVPFKLLGGGGNTTNNTTTNNTTNNYYGGTNKASNPLYLQNAKSVIQ